MSDTAITTVPSMDLAIKTFLSSDRVEKIRLQEILNKSPYCPEWLSQNICKKLLEHPLHIDSQTHALFYQRIKPGVKIGKNKTEKDLLTIAVDRTILLVSHYEFLVVLLETLTDHKFYAELKSIHEIPFSILRVCISEKTLRCFVFNNLSAECYEDLDVRDLVRKIQLGFEIQINTIADLLTHQPGFDTDTPPPRLDTRYVPNAKRQKVSPHWEDFEEFLAYFPERQILNPTAKRLPIDSGRIEILLTSYTIIWSTMKAFIKTLSRRRAHQLGKKLSMRSVFPMVLALTAQSFDQRTLRHQGLKKIFIERDLSEELQMMANLLDATLTDGNVIDPRYNEGVEVNKSRANRLLGIYEKNILMKTSGGHKYFKNGAFGLVPITRNPSMSFIAELDFAEMFGSTSMRVREFLYKKNRLEYFAYEFPSHISLCAVEVALAKITNRCNIPIEEGEPIPIIKDYILTPTAFAGPAIVCKPTTMLALRMVANLNAFIARKLEPTCYWRLCIRDLIYAPPASCPELHDIAVFCMASALFSRLATKENQRGLQWMFLPGDEFFHLYRLIPTLCRQFPFFYHRTTLQEARESLLVLLEANRRERRWLSLKAWVAVSDHLEDKIDFTDPRTMAVVDGLETRRNKCARKHVKKLGIPMNHTVRGKSTFPAAELWRAFLSREPVLSAHLETLLGHQTKAIKMAPQERETPMCGKTKKAVLEFEEFEEIVQKLEMERIGRHIQTKSLLLQAYNYYLTQSFSIPSQCRTVEIKYDASSYPCGTLPMGPEMSKIPHRKCTRKNIQSHIDYYMNTNFVSILGLCFLGVEQLPGEVSEELKQIMSMSVPMAHELRLVDGSTMFETECFILPILEFSSVGEVPELNEYSTDTCQISDLMAMNLIIEYGQELKARNDVTYNLNCDQTYIECMRHLQEMMADESKPSQEQETKLKI